MDKGSNIEKYYDHLNHQDWKPVVVKKDNKSHVESNKKIQRMLEQKR